MLISKHFKWSVIGCALMLTSCGMPKDMLYYQDVTSESEIEIAANHAIVARPNDELLILVNSEDPLTTTMFNLPILSTQAGRGDVMNYSQQVSPYTVDSKGCIDFPVLGEVKVGGLTREEIASTIKADLMAKQLVKNPVVTVDFLNAYYSVTGEVLTPGRYALDRDQLTIVDALAKAGDLTIYGDRVSVKLLRTENGKQKSYILDLTSAEQMAKSPAYYVQQSDIIYVSPNSTRARQSTVNGNNLISTSFWLSLASVLVSVAVLIVK